MADTFTVIISAPEGVVYKGEARQLDAHNSLGPFSIMADHARFLTVLSEAPIAIEGTSGEVAEHTFPKAVLFFQDDTAYIYTQPKMA